MSSHVLSFQTLYKVFLKSYPKTQLISSIPLEEALQIPEWKTIIKEEIRALEKNGALKLAELPKGKNPVRVSGSS
ncbi:hypothetical protein CK203_058452 [Vitis vinifera]|uniref:Uncharacterized protein n=1 Tax=Vitis vinifera TaxID=29760 RepID=A0A438H1R9_VITVI|nr:hypothetical protein CK203_058452 [Vitis vinifera]